MDIANNFPVQVAFISLCKNNRNSNVYVGALHQALQNALGGESRSWAIGAILAASSHGGVGAADGYAVSVYQDVVGKLNDISNETGGNTEEFAKRSTPLFATFKAVLEVPLSQEVSSQIASGIALHILPMCWTRLVASPSVFEVGPNEYLSVLGAQFLQSASSTASQMNAAFQFFLGVAQVAGLCLCICPDDQTGGLSALTALFNPSWNLRPSLINILVTNVATQAASSRSLVVCKLVLPGAIQSLENAALHNSADEFTVASFAKATSSIVNCLLGALQITTDDDFAISEFSGAPKPTLSNRQVKNQQRTRNRFTAISEESTAASTPQPMGHRIPRELWAEPEVALGVISKCLMFRSDKALRRMFQCVPTIITRWWNSISNDATLSARFVSAVPELIFRPITGSMEMVRNRDPVTLTGGSLHSYASERAVSGRRLASELVDHATISIHGALAVLWRFGSSHMGGSSANSLAVVSSFPPLGSVIKMLIDATRAPPTGDSIDRIISCAKEQSLESRAALKFIVESATRDPVSLGSDQGVSKDLIGATNQDISAANAQSIVGVPTDDSGPPGRLFEH
jgi:hypothetical protein